MIMSLTFIYVLNCAALDSSQLVPDINYVCQFTSPAAYCNERGFGCSLDADVMDIVLDPSYCELTHGPQELIPEWPAGEMFTTPIRNGSFLVDDQSWDDSYHLACVRARSTTSPIVDQFTAYVKKVSPATSPPRPIPAPLRGLSVPVIRALPPK